MKKFLRLELDEVEEQHLKTILATPIVKDYLEIVRYKAIEELAGISSSSSIGIEEAHHVVRGKVAVLDLLIQVAEQSQEAVERTSKSSE